MSIMQCQHTIYPSCIVTVTISQSSNVKATKCQSCNVNTKYINLAMSMHNMSIIQCYEVTVGHEDTEGGQVPPISTKATLRLKKQTFSKNA